MAEGAAPAEDAPEEEEAPETDSAGATGAATDADAAEADAADGGGEEPQPQASTKRISERSRVERMARVVPRDNRRHKQIE